MNSFPKKKKCIFLKVFLCKVPDFSTEYLLLVTGIDLILLTKLTKGVNLVKSVIASFPKLLYFTSAILL